MDIRQYVFIFLFVERVLGICQNSNFIEDPTKKKCYLLSSTLSSWFDAKAQCEALGAMLAKIEDDIDHQFVKRNMVFDVYYWIGMNDIVADGTYVWTDNTPVTWTSWKDGQPNGGANQSCVTYDKSQTWQDKNCTKLYYSVCQEIQEKSMKQVVFKRVTSIADIAPLDSLQAFDKISCMMRCSEITGCKYAVVDMSAASNCQLFKPQAGGQVPFPPSPTLYFYQST